MASEAARARRRLARRGRRASSMRRGISAEIIGCQFTPKVLTAAKRWLTGNPVGELGDHRRDLRRRHRSAARCPRGLARQNGRVVPRSEHVGPPGSIVALIPVVRTGDEVDLLFANACRLHTDREDLIQKAVGWALREAGKIDPGSTADRPKARRGSKPTCCSSARRS